MVKILKRRFTIIRTKHTLEVSANIIAMLPILCYNIRPKEGIGVKDVFETVAEAI